MSDQNQNSFVPARQLPSKENLEVIPVNLSAEYWSPQAIGEFKEALFVGIQTGRMVKSFSNPNELVPLDCCEFIEEIAVKDGEGKITGKKFQTFFCGQSHLVSLFKGLPAGGVYQIVFTGSKKNKSNNNMSNTFEVFAMLPKESEVSNA